MFLFILKPSGFTISTGKTLNIKKKQINIFSSGSVNRQLEICGNKLSAGPKVKYSFVNKV